LNNPLGGIHDILRHEFRTALANRVTVSRLYQHTRDSSVDTALDIKGFISDDP
jgi:hypothetical protein